MDNIIENNFKAVQQSLKSMNKKIEDQEKKIISYSKSHQMLLSTINTLQQEICLLKALSIGNGPTKV